MRSVPVTWLHLPCDGLANDASNPRTRPVKSSALVSSRTLNQRQFRELRRSEGARARAGRARRTVPQPIRSDRPGTNLLFLAPREKGGGYFFFSSAGQFTTRVMGAELCT